MQCKDNGASRQHDSSLTGEFKQATNELVSGAEVSPERRPPRRRVSRPGKAKDREPIPSRRFAPEEEEHESSSSKYKGDGGAGPIHAICPRPQFHRVDKRTGEVIGIVGCKGRYCPACGPRLKASHIAHYIEVFLELPALLFLTLTLDPKSVLDRSPSAYADALVGVWGAFMKNLGERCRRAGVSRHYFGAVEGLGGGWPHIHAIVSCPLPDAAATIEQMWFLQGGGIVMEVTSMGTGEEEIARRVGYVLKEQFVPGIPRRNLLTSNGIGYNTAEAKRRRREHVTPDGRSIILDKVRDVEPRPRRSPSKRRRAFREEVLNSGRRSRQCVHRRQGTPYGIRVRAAESGELFHDVVRIDWDAERANPTYTTVIEDVGDSASAHAAVDRLSADGRDNT